jgi:cobalt-zinc-cadmium efflux system membrane fusion protein
MKLNWKLPLAVVVIAAGATGLALNNWTRAQVVGVLKQISQATAHGDQSLPDKSWLEKSAAKTNAPWDRTLTLEPDQIKALGLMTVEVKKQTEPWPLRLTGMTDYDPAKVTIVRTQFDSRVDKVLVDLGSPVKIGDPLLELFSTDLAEAKSNYEVAISQWVHDKEVLDYKTPLALINALPRKELIEVKNDEAQSRLKMKLARDKLLIYGLTEEEIAKIPKENGQEKTRFTLRTPVDGAVIAVGARLGEFYDRKDVLIRIRTNPAAKDPQP